MIALECNPTDTIKHNYLVREAGTGGSAGQDAGLRPLVYWDCGFESHRGHVYLSVVSVVC